MKRLNQKGFTIIELLISTVIFAVILLVITGAIVQFGRLYYRGVVQSRTQESARAISQDVEQAIQFSRSVPVANPASGDGVLCIGERRYTYRLNAPLVSPATPHVLVSDSNPGCGTGYTGMTTAALTGDAKELLGDNMQLVELSARETVAGSGLWQITVHVAYGNDEDLLPGKTGCRPVAIGGQFCAVSRLTTTVTQRLK